jgi:hypothetical protein
LFKPRYLFLKLMLLRFDKEPKFVEILQGDRVFARVGKFGGLAIGCVERADQQIVSGRLA